MSLNQAINDAHHAHYTDSTPLGLLEPDTSPNGNIIFHLYDDGMVTQQKGGWAYLQRNEFTMLEPLSGRYKLNLDLVKKTKDDMTYVILTFEECKAFRDLMKEEIKKSTLK